MIDMMDINQDDTRLFGQCRPDALMKEIDDELHQVSDVDYDELDEVSEIGEADE